MKLSCQGLYVKLFMMCDEFQAPSRSDAIDAAGVLTPYVPTPSNPVIANVLG
jgi:hypothetical protein